MLQQVHCGIDSLRNWKRGLQEVLVQPCSLQHHSQWRRVERTEGPVDTRMGTPSVAFPCSGLLFHLKRERDPVTCHNSDGPGRHHAKWNKLRAKRRILYDSSCTRSLKESKPIETKSRMLVAREQGREGMRVCLRGTEFQVCKRKISRDLLHDNVNMLNSTDHVL